MAVFSPAVIMAGIEKDSKPTNIMNREFCIV
jgi:hypothetical protein